MTDTDKAKAIERANAYRDMMNGWAWKDLMKSLLSEKDERVNKILTEKGYDNLEFTKGFVACVQWLDNEVGYVLEGAS